MKLIKKLLIIIAVFLGLAASIYFGIPIGSEKGKTETVGLRKDGREIIAEQVYRYRIHPLSPEGAFYRSAWHYTFFYERSDKKKTKLLFFTDENHDYELLKPILPVANSDNWAAFRLSRVEKEMVDLIMYIFDSTSIRHTFEIKNVIRVSTCSGWGDTVNYSVTQSVADGIITINTLDGLLMYDQSSNKLLKVGAATKRSG